MRRQWIVWRVWDRAETLTLCACRFVHRVWRYRHALAHDYDFDWAPLAHLMELKLLAMAGALDARIHVGDERRARECRTAATLCRRLRADAYHEMHPHHMQRAMASERNDARYLGRLMGRCLRSWWC